MKEEIEKLAKKTGTDIANKPISRKEAIKKTGYIAVSAATTMLLLSSPNAQATSPCEDDRHRNRGSNNNDDHDKDKDRDRDGHH